MKPYYDAKENDRVAMARESFSGRLLTDRQFDEAMTITGIIEAEIQHSGSFKDKLGDYAFAFARTEKFDATKAETIIRDLFKERTGQTMNQMREDYAKREEAITDNHRAQARQLAEEIGVTDACAKRLMREEFKAAENAELFDWGKELDERFYRPQIEAEKAERAAPQEPERRQQSLGRSFRSRPGPQ